MDSINRNQPEENRKDPASKEAIERIREMADEADSCFFCTSEEGGESQGVRPMHVEKADDQGNLWFLSASDSGKNREIESDPRVQIMLQRSENAGFLMQDGPRRRNREDAGRFD